MVRKPSGETAVGVICAYNEEQNIGRAVRTLRTLSGLDEVVVVDGHSEDRTRFRAERAGARVVDQRVACYPGKGVAVQTALQETDQDVLLFFDADIRNMEAWQPAALLGAMQDPECGHAMARFTRKAGRVTELTAKPLFRALFPEVRFRQPLSGEFASRRSVLGDIEVVEDWGVEAGLVIDLAMRGVAVREVDTGHKEHPMKPLAELREMADQVVRTILDKAVAYGRLQWPDDGRSKGAIRPTVEDVAPLSV